MTLFSLYVVKLERTIRQEKETDPIKNKRDQLVNRRKNPICLYKTNYSATKR